MDNALITKLGEIQKDLVERLDEQKKQVNAIEAKVGETITKAEFDDRLKQAKDEFSTKAEHQEIVKQMAAIAESNTSRNVHIDVPDLNEYRQVAEFATTPKEAQTIYSRFLQTQPTSDLVREYHKLSSRLAILQSMGRFSAQRKGGDYTVSNSHNLDVRRMWNRYQQLQRDLFPEDFYARAFDTTDASEWVPTVMASDLVRYVELVGSVIPNIRLFPLPAPNWDLPYVTSAGEAKGFTEKTAGPSAALDYSVGGNYTSDNAPAGKITFAVERLRSKLISSREFIEESAVAVLDFMIEDAGNGIRRALENGVINGDSATAHIDSGISYSADASNAVDNRTLFDGFRLQIHETGSHLNNTTRVSATSNHATIGNMVSVRAAMGVYGVDPKAGMWLCGLRSYLDLLDLTDFLTMEKVGSMATIVQGQLGMMLGSPVVVSEKVRQDLQSTGLYTTSTGSQTAMYYIYRPGWWFGQWRGITIEPERIPMFNMDVIWAWYGGDLQCVYGPTAATAGAIVDID